MEGMYITGHQTTLVSETHIFFIHIESALCAELSVIIIYSFDVRMQSSICNSISSFLITSYCINFSGF